MANQDSNKKRDTSNAVKSGNSSSTGKQSQGSKTGSSKTSKDKGMGMDSSRRKMADE